VRFRAGTVPGTGTVYQETGIQRTALLDRYLEPNLIGLQKPLIF
jgi:hypothetical protein